MANTPDGGETSIEQVLGDAVQRSCRIERQLRIRQLPSRAATSKTDATVAMVIGRMLSGDDLSAFDDFWIQVANRELAGRVAARDQVLLNAVQVLIHKRMHPARARELAIAVLIAAEHPAFTDPLIASVPFSTDGGQAATA